MTTELHRTLLAHVATAVAPLAAVTDVEGLRRLLAAVGWDLDALAGFDTGVVVDALTGASTAIEKVATLLTDPGRPADLADFAATVGALGQAAGSVVTAVQGWKPLDVDPDVAGLLGADLVAGLLYGHLHGAAPRLAAVLRLAGALRAEPAPAVTSAAGVVLRAAGPRPVIDLGALRDVLSDPVAALTRRFRDDPATGRRAAEEVADLAGPLLAGTLEDFGLDAMYGLRGPGRGAGLTEPETAAARHVLLVSTPSDMDSDGSLAGVLRLAMGLTDDTAGAGLGLAMVVGGAVSLTAGELTVTAAGVTDPMLLTGSGVTGGDSELRLELAYRCVPAAGRPLLRFGASDGTRVQLAGLELRVALGLGDGAPDVVAEIELRGLQVALAAGEGDGFLNRVLPAEPVAVVTDLGADWSVRGGFALRGAARFEVALPVHLDLGPVQVTRAEVALVPGDREWTARATVSAAVALGPFVASVQGVGLRAAVRPDRLDGPLQIDFQPPTGVGLVVDAPMVSGGGYLTFDKERREYAGVLELRLGELTISAIGMITTRPGEFSLLVIVSVAFSAVQLGYGFTINGVGGLLAVNRTIDLAAIEDGLAGGALDAILFPRDPVRNAPQLLATLDRYFPAAAGQFVIGPSAVLGWGTPRIVTITLGLFVELPRPLRIVLAGKVRMVLPDADTAVAEINIDVLGSLDLTRRRLAIDATLRDSRIAGFTIAGDVAIRATWGDAPGFLFSAGGFHPRFASPARVRPLRRLSIALASGDNPRLRLEAYLAVTSNTVQFGARLDLYAAVDIGLGTFSVGAVVGFDALVQFSPFRFEVDIYAAVVLRWNGSPFLGVDLRAVLSGPQPWQARGEATFRFLGSHTVRFELTVGDEPPPAPPDRVDVTGQLRRALADPANWDAERPRDVVRVALRRVTAGDGLRVHPLAALTVRQQVVPLGMDLTRFGAGLPDATRYELGLLGPGGTRTALDPVISEPFARAQFVDLTDSEKLTAPSFEPLPAGVRLGSGALTFPEPAVRRVADLDYEEHVVDGDPRPVRTAEPFRLDTADLPRLIGGGAVARAGAGPGGPDRPGVELRPLTYTVVALDAMSGHDAPAPTSFGQAVQTLHAKLADQPWLTGLLGVVGEHEVTR